MGKSIVNTIVHLALGESECLVKSVGINQLAEHTINSEHRPFIEITIKGQAIRKIEFVARLFLKLNGFVLKIQKGDIKEIQTGTCEIGGSLEYEGVKLAEKRLEPVSLPGSVVVA